jgi:hypothetical protein
VNLSFVPQISKSKLTRTFVLNSNMYTEFFKDTEKIHMQIVKMV